MPTQIPHRNRKDPMPALAVDLDRSSPAPPHHAPGAHVFHQLQQFDGTRALGARTPHGLSPHQCVPRSMN